MSRTLRTLVVSSGIFLLAGCASATGTPTMPAESPGATSAAEPATFAVNGSLTLFDLDASRSNCKPDGGYSDIQEGASVVVKDDKGTKVGIGSLDVGRSLEAGSCVFTFRVTKVPAGAGIYSVEVTHRGEVTYSEADLRQGIEISLGN